jgi:hypothetical protein
MAEEQAKATGGEGETTGGDEFKPESLSPEAQEYIRRKIQSDSDSKAAAVEQRLRAEQATRARSAVEQAEERELTSLAESGQHEALGQRVAARLARRSVEERAITDASNEIERQMSAAFAETLGPDKVEEIRQETVKAGGAHAEFAQGLAKASEAKTRSEEIAAEVRAGLIAAGVMKRDEDPGADKATGGGQGPKLSTFDEIEQAFVEGKVSIKAYEAAQKARDEGR